MGLLKKKVSLEELAVIAANFAMSHTINICLEKKIELGYGKNDEVDMGILIELAALHGFVTIVIASITGWIETQKDVFFQELHINLLKRISIILPEGCSGTEADENLILTSNILHSRMNQYLDIVSTQDKIRADIELGHAVLHNIARQNANNVSRGVNKVFLSLNFDDLYGSILKDFYEIFVNYEI